MENLNPERVSALLARFAHPSPVSAGSECAEKWHLLLWQQRRSDVLRH